MAAVVVAAVHEDGLQQVVGRVGLVDRLKVGVQVDPLRELKPETRRRGGEGGAGSGGGGGRRGGGGRERSGT